MTPNITTVEDVRLKAVVLVLGVLVAGAVAWLALASGDAPPPRPVPNHAFAGAPKPVKPLIVWAVGDGAADTTGAKEMAHEIASDDPDRVLYLGDVYESGQPSEFRSGMLGVYGRSLLHRMLPTPGNHEWP